jgi:hypothetical protein
VTEPAARWTDLPAPGAPADRWELEVPAAAWAHVRDKHLADRREPWRDWLGAEAVARCGADPAAVLAALGAAARASLGRPLVLAYVAVVAPGRRGGGEVWQLVLPAGALLVARRGADGRRRVATCFFPRAACAEDNPARRWRKAVASLVRRHAVRGPSGRDLVPPAADDLVPGAGGAPACARVRFLTPEQWGFATELRGTPWRGRLGSWDAAAAPAPRPKRRLKPRRREEGCDD